MLLLEHHIKPFLPPKLAASRAEINRLLTENKVETNIEAFLDEAKRRVEVVILSEV